MKFKKYQTNIFLLHLQRIRRSNFILFLVLPKFQKTFIFNFGSGGFFLPLELLLYIQPENIKTVTVFRRKNLIIIHLYLQLFIFQGFKYFK